MKLYLDASALVKRYVSEPSSDLVRAAMDEADAWYICRLGFVEVMRAVGIAAGNRATRAIGVEWAAFGIVEIDQTLVENASALALEHDLRSADSVHLAAALVLPTDDLKLATWDQRLHRAAKAEGLETVPKTIA